MPAISRIRFTNVVYEGGNKRYNDEVFTFDGHNGAILLENGGGKTVFIQTAIQAVLPHVDMAGRKIKDTLSLTGTPAHIAIEWILSDVPRRYALTAVTLFMSNNELDSYRYVYEYKEGDGHAIEHIPFVKEANGKKRPAGKDEIHDYYISMSAQHMNAHTFSTLKEYHAYLEQSYQIVASEWRKIAVINSAEGGVDKFFDDCHTTGQLVDQLLIPTVEEALAGSGSVGFSETFEKKSEQFKQSKLLRMQIAESQLVETQIQLYCQVFAEYDDAMQEFVREKKRSKSLYFFASAEMDLVERNLDQIHTQKDEALADISKVKRQKRSREIALDQRQLVQQQLQHQEQSRLLAEKETALSDTEHEQHTTEYAKYQMRKCEAEDNKKYDQERLARLDEDEDISLLREDSEINARQIKGCYVDAEDTLMKEAGIVKRQMEIHQLHLTQLQQSAALIESDKNKALQVNAKWTGIREASQEQMTRIANKILHNPLQETVEEMLPKWKRQIEESMKNQQQYSDQVTESNEKKTNKKKERREKEEILNQEKARLHEWKSRFEQAESEQQKVLVELKAVYPKFNYMDSLYPKESSIVQTLLEGVAVLEKEKEQLLLKERTATRMSDEYEESNIFMSEPDLLKWVDRWRDQFDYLETGTKFLQEVCRTTGKSEQELYDIYPYWSATLITTGDEMDRLASRLEEVSDRLRFPVLLANNREMNISSDEFPLFGLKERQVLPQSWRDNLNQQRFVEWKATLKSLADEASHHRKEKERDLQSRQKLLDLVQAFFYKYPHDVYQEWKIFWLGSQDTVESLEKAIRETDQLIENYETTWKLYNEKLQEEKNNHTNISHQVQDGSMYLAQKQKMVEAQNEQRMQGERIANFDVKWNKLKEDEKALNGQITDLQPRLENNNASLSRLRGEELYRELKEVSPLTSTSTMDTLRLIRQDLLSRLRKQQTGRELLENQIKKYENDIRRAESDMQSVQSKVNRPIDSELEFPVDGDDRIAWLGQLIKKLKDECQGLRDRVNKYENQVSALTAQIETNIKFFKNEFPGQEMDQFMDDLETVYEQLLLEEKTLNQKMGLIEQERLRMGQAFEQLKEACEILKMKNERFQFNHPSIDRMELSEEEQMAFPYDRVNTVQKRIAALDKAERQQNTQFEKLNKKKEAFKQFCQQKIQDIRLRDKAISGIENKQGYHDVQEWAQRMGASITNGIRILEEDLRGHDEQLQHFIVQIHDHVKKVASELNAIPKRTSVKVDDYLKQIYSFAVPEWKEEYGKQAIRSYIDWMLAEQNSERFKDSEGKEDVGKMKKWIMTTLQTKQLLRIVMGSDSIKVKCRKVSNDGKVSGALTSWEESNKWSGGEKWSKNMTLFLGILNYLSEKNHRVERKGLRSRTVIMDNPFGQASSEHVLDPVFFIADQLGFQIIALTALVEGKFIRDYFPIVYSCRLRETVNGNASIMTKEKEIKQAYFRDRDPFELYRISEHEQLSLFTL